MSSARRNGNLGGATRVMAAVRYRSRRLLVWAIVLPLTSIRRHQAKRAQLQPGVTIVTVSYNTLGYLRAMVAGVRLYSPPGTPIIVVDNGSKDGCVRWAKQQPDLRVVRLPTNVLHGPAMNLGLALCRTEYFVALDVDAFPISPTWLSELLQPLSQGMHVSGAGYPPTPEHNVQPYVHACCLTMRTSRFLDQDHTFCPGTTWDTGQSISQREWPHVHTVPITASRGPGILGSVFGDIVYHNFYAARFHTSTLQRIDWIDRGQPEDAWAAAMDQYFPNGLRCGQ